MIIEAEIKQWGNSYGIRIPKRVAEHAGLREGDRVTIPLPKRRDDVWKYFGRWKGTAPFKRDRADDFHDW